MYLPFKTQVQSIINRHFPTEIAKRFSFRMDSEIWIPGMDEAIWLRKKTGKESCHVMFDMVDLFEIPVTLNPRQAEVGILRSFKAAILNGTIVIERKPEYTDNQTARRRKGEKVKETKKAVQEAYQYAQVNPMSVEQIDKMVNDQQKRVLKIKEEVKP